MPRFWLLLILIFPLVVACSGPDESLETDETPAPTAARPTATATLEPVATATTVPEPAVTAVPTEDLPAPALEPTGEPEAPAQAPPVSPPAVIPDSRPVDQHVTLPDVDAHYALNITELNIDSGFVRVSQTITMREFRQPPDQLLLQVPAAAYGFFTLDSMALNGEPVTPDTLNDGFTLSVELPRGLQAPAALQIEFHLNVGGDSTGWGYSMLDADVLRLGYWYPAISDDHGWSDLLDPSYTRVADFDVTVVTERGMPVAHTGEWISETALENGLVQYSFTASDTRDFALVFSRAYQVSRTTSASGVEIEYYWRAAADTGLTAEAAEQRRQNVLFWTADAVNQLDALIGSYPYPALRIVDAGPAMPAGVEFAMLIYITPGYHELDRLIYHEVAHEWFYAILGTRTLIEGWVDEGGAEFFERGLPTGFNEVPSPPSGGYQYPLDAHYHEIQDSERDAAYFAIYEQGARLYYDVLGTMGWEVFWMSMRDLYERYRFDIMTAWDLLATWQRHSEADLRPLYNDYFRYTWIDDLPGPGVETHQGWVPILGP